MCKLDVSLLCALNHWPLVTAYDVIELADNTRPLLKPRLIYYQQGLWQSFEDNFISKSQTINDWDVFENYIFKIKGTIPGDQ